MKYICLYFIIGAALQLLMMPISHKVFASEIDEIGFKKVFLYYVLDIILWPYFIYYGIRYIYRFLKEEK